MRHKLLRNIIEFYKGSCNEPFTFFCMEEAKDAIFTKKSDLYVASLKFKTFDGNFCHKFNCDEQEKKKIEYFFSIFKTI